MTIEQKINRLQEVVSMARKDEILTPLEKKAAKKVGGIFMWQGNLFLERFKKHKTSFSEAVTQGDLGMDFSEVFDLTSAELKQTLKEIASAALGAGAAEQIADLGMDISFSVDNPRAQQFIEQRGAEMVTRINDTTRSRINTILRDSSKHGWNYTETADRIKGEFKSFAGRMPQRHIRDRATLVAVTENAKAFGRGKKEAVTEMMDMGLEMEKYWSNSGDDRVSDGCLENSSVGWIDENDSFPSGDDYEPRFSGCRCNVMHRRKKSQNG